MSSGSPSVPEPLRELAPLVAVSTLVITLTANLSKFFGGVAGPLLDGRITPRATECIATAIACAGIGLFAFATTRNKMPRIAKTFVVTGLVLAGLAGASARVDIARFEDEALRKLPLFVQSSIPGRACEIDGPSARAVMLELQLPENVDGGMLHVCSVRDGDTPVRFLPSPGRDVGPALDMSSCLRLQLELEPDVRQFISGICVTTEEDGDPPLTASLVLPTGQRMNFRDGGPYQWPRDQ